MKKPSISVIKHLYAKSGNICAFPGCNLSLWDGDGNSIGEVCHIEARSKNGPRYNPKQTNEERNGFNNLILMCSNHHQLIDSNPDMYDVEALKEIKRIHEITVGRDEVDSDIIVASKIAEKSYELHIVKPNKTIIASPGAIQNNVTNIVTSSKKAKIAPPTGSIGDDKIFSAYISYLIRRYNEFASSEKNRKTKFNYGAISKNIETKLGAKWQLLSISSAEEVIAYLESRILKTRIAKINRGKGRKCFSTLKEFLEKHPNIK